jgi:hypothetical protein
MPTSSIKPKKTGPNQKKRKEKGDKPKKHRSLLLVLVMAGTVII